MKAPSRLDTSPFAEWWWSVDRVCLGAAGVLIFIGIVLCQAAGPAAAARIGISDPYHFVIRQAVFLIPALATMFAVSMLSPLQARRLGVAVFGLALVGCVLAILVGPEIKGAHRWLDLGPIAIQPSEFAKPGFVVLAAWMLAEGARDARFPGGFIAMGLYAVFAFILLAEPDYGQWALVTAVWGVVFFVAGWSWAWIAGLGAAAAGALGLAYLSVPHVTSRIDRFLRPEHGDTYQVDKAMEAIAHGGLFGQGPGEGIVKRQLPDAHTDFIFAVGGEEFGFFLGALIIIVFAILVIRVFMVAGRQRSVFVQCASCGLAGLLGVQAIVNIGVNLRMMPAKGMTLPFISYGGSSLIATGLTIGLILALTRQRPQALRRKEIMP